jgi:hypothetical protein
MLTNVVKLWHILMMWFLWEKDYKILKNLHLSSCKQIRWDNKYMKKDKICDSIMKALQ